MVKRIQQDRNAISFGDSASIDAFGRARFSQPFTLHESALQYDLQPLIWDTAQTNGTITHIPNESSATMSIGQVDGDYAIRQTKSYVRYESGKSQMIMMSGVLGEQKANVVKRVGYFDDSNGLFFELNGNNLCVCRRTNVTGTPTDNKVPQSSWNIDKMNGQEPSRVTIDPEKVQIFIIDFEWLGSGRIRWGFVIDGLIYYVHEELVANVLDGVYMTTGNLPVRYEVRNTDNTTSNSSIKQICSTVMSEGGFDEAGYKVNASNGVSGVTVGNTAYVAVLSIRPKLTFNSIANRGLVIPEKYSLITNTNDIHFRVERNATLTSPTWTDVGANTISEYSVNDPITVAGKIIDSDYAVSGAGASSAGKFDEVINSKLPLVLSFDGTTSDTLTISARALSGSATVFASLSYREVF